MKRTPFIVRDIQTRDNWIIWAHMHVFVSALVSAAVSIFIIIDAKITIYLLVTIWCGNMPTLRLFFGLRSLMELLQGASAGHQLYFVESKLRISLSNSGGSATYINNGML